MVFTYYRIYVVASEQDRSLKLGVKQIEMSFIGENHSMGKMGTDTGTETTSPSSSLTNRKSNNKNVNSKINVSSADYRSGFALRMHRGGGGGSSAIVSGTKSVTNIKKRPDKESRIELIKKKCSSLTGRRSDDDNRFNSISTYNKNAIKRISEDSTSFDVDDLDDKHQPHSHHKMTNWSVGRRLTKLAKGLDKFVFFSILIILTLQFVGLNLIEQINFVFFFKFRFLLIEAEFLLFFGCKKQNPI